MFPIRVSSPGKHWPITSHMTQSLVQNQSSIRSGVKVVAPSQVQVWHSYSDPNHRFRATSRTKAIQNSITVSHRIALRAITEVPSSFEQYVSLSLHRCSSSHSAIAICFDNAQAGMSSAADTAQSDIFLVDVTDAIQASPFRLQVCGHFYGYILTSPHSYGSVNAAYTFAGHQ